MRNRRIEQSKVSITKNSNESAAVIEGLQLLEVPKAINSDDVIVITANWVNKKQPYTADVVGDITLGSIIKFFKDLNPKRIVVAAGSGDGNTRGIMEFVGYDKVIDELGVEFVDLNNGPYEEITLNNEKPATTKLNTLFQEMTFHVSFTQLKIHEEGTISASIKNMAMSWPSTEEHGAPKKDTGIHDDLHKFITAMAMEIPIDLSIISASPAMIATGPHNGIAKHTDLVICGTDPVSADAVGSRFLGFKPQAVHYLYNLVNNKIGAGDVENLYIFGMSLIEGEKVFSMAAYENEVSVD